MLEEARARECAFAAARETGKKEKRGIGIGSGASSERRTLIFWGGKGKMDAVSGENVGEHGTWDRAGRGFGRANGDAGAEKAQGSRIKQIVSHTLTFFLSK